MTRDAETISFPRLMKTLLLAALVASIPLSAAAADILGGAVEITPAKGWVGKPRTPARVPTLSYAPAGGDDGKVVISLFRSADVDVHDATSLLEFHRKLCRGYGGAKVVVPLRQFTPPAGDAVSVTFEDAALVGKTPRKGDFRTATVVCAFLPPEFVAYTTIYTNESSGPAYEAGLAMATSGRIIPVAQRPTLPAPLVSFRELGAELQLPAGFERINEQAHPSPHYFYFGNGKVLLSGWLEPAARYRKNKSFAEFWAGERKAMEKSGKIVVSDETVKDLGGWGVALYRVTIAGAPASQRNLRACRIVGDTWADVHLSSMRQASDFADLESTLEALVLRPKTKAKSNP